MLYKMRFCLISSSTEYTTGVPKLHNKKFCMKLDIIVAAKPTLP